MTTDPLRQARQRFPHAPVRTCVGCRRREGRSALLRVVARTREDETTVALPDERHRLAGRGAWLHPAPDCFESAVRRKALRRALRVGDGLDVAPVRQWFENRST